ncbi:unnamed protein product [Hermetia illucens]|uniref:Uncharacterized protein n=2 Tax=Hermetia illucens TaxID=343691 RepID=A0A7R8UD62_HERIL|nr:unnamed protein product [Hermetia illucens]
MLIVIILKCKKVVAPYLMYTSDMHLPDRRPSVHIIQLDNETTSQTAYTVGNEEVGSCPEVLTNSGYEHDMDIIVNAPPPSYEEVMRQPGIYPKVQDLKYI